MCSTNHPLILGQIFVGAVLECGCSGASTWLTDLKDRGQTLGFRSHSVASVPEQLPMAALFNLRSTRVSCECLEVDIEDAFLASLSCIST